MVTYAQQTDPEKARLSSIGDANTKPTPQQAPQQNKQQKQAVVAPNNGNNVSEEQAMFGSGVPTTPKTSAPTSESTTPPKQAAGIPTTKGNYYQDVYLPKVQAERDRRKQLQVNEAFATKASTMRAEDVSTGYLQGTVTAGELDTLRNIDPNKYDLAKANIDKQRQLDAINNNQEEFLRNQKTMQENFLSKWDKLARNDEGKKLVEKVFEDYGLRQSNDNIKSYTTQINDVNDKIENFQITDEGNAKVGKAEYNLQMRELMKQRTSLIQARSAEMDYYNLGLEQADRVAKEYDEYNQMQIEMLGKEFEMTTGMSAMEFEQKDGFMKEKLKEIDGDIADAEASIAAQQKQKQDTVFNTAVLSMYENLPEESKAILVGLPTEQVSTFLKTVDAKEKMMYDREFAMMEFDFEQQKFAQNQQFDMYKFNTEQANRKKWDFFKGEGGDIVRYNESSGEYEILNTKQLPGIDVSARVKPTGSKGGQCGFYTNRLIPGMSQGGKWFGDSLQSKINMLDSTVPVVGGAFVMDTGTKYGHVGVVTGVNADGTITITDSNWSGDEVVRNKTLSKAEMKTIVGYMAPPTQEINLESVSLPEKATEYSKKSFTFANRMKNAHEKLLAYDLENTYLNRTGIGQTYQDLVPNIAKSNSQKDLEAFKESFIMAVLRLETGASISTTEFERTEKIYFPLPGDNKDTLKKKQNLRQQAIKGMYTQAGSDSSGTPIGQLYNPQEIEESLKIVNEVSRNQSINVGSDFSVAFPGANLLSTLN